MYCLDNNNIDKTQGKLYFSILGGLPFLSFLFLSFYLKGGGGVANFNGYLLGV